MGSLHKALLLHTDIQWLSHRKMLSKFCELKDEIKMFPSEHASKTAYELNDTD